MRTEEFIGWFYKAKKASNYVKGDPKEAKGVNIYLGQEDDLDLKDTVRHNYRLALILDMDVHMMTSYRGFITPRTTRITRPRRTRRTCKLFKIAIIKPVVKSQLNSC